MSSSSLSLVLFLALVALSHAHHPIIVGTAAQYDPPYTPTACFGNKPPPSNGLFGAAGEGLWNNGAACGKKYQVTCISAGAPTSCKPGTKVEVEIIDRAKTSKSRPSEDDATIVLSKNSYSLIAFDFETSVNVQLQPV